MTTNNNVFGYASSIVRIWLCEFVRVRYCVDAFGKMLIFILCFRFVGFEFIYVMVDAFVLKIVLTSGQTFVDFPELDAICE